MPKTTNSSLSPLLPTTGPVLSETTVTSLWAGYGSISRLKTKSTTHILKHISLEPPEDHNDISHKRKHASYLVEKTFYSDASFAKSITNPVTNIPQIHNILEDNYPATGTIEIRMLMSDLSPNFPISSSSTTLLQTLSALRWLASFHAHFWNSRPSQPPPQLSSLPTTNQLNLNPQTGVWSQGGYWHLPTRITELSSISPSSPYRSKALKINNLLHEGKLCTLLHGDPKSENILFAPSSSSMTSAVPKDLTTIPDSQIPTCAFHDFQYTGYGPGAVDVAHFIATSVSSSLLSDSSMDALLRYYHAKTMEYLGSWNEEWVEGVREEWTFEVFERQFGLAVADWVRFMDGWGTWGNWRWAKGWADRVIEGL